MISFDPVINAGQVITAIAFFSTVCGILWKQSHFQAVTERRLAEGELARLKYIPIIEALLAAQNASNSQMASFIDGFRENRLADRELIKELRDADNSLVKEFSKLSERLVAIEALLQNGQGLLLKAGRKIKP
jgi:hypothetical protein